MCVCACVFVCCMLTCTHYKNKTTDTGYLAIHMNLCMLLVTLSASHPLCRISWGISGYTTSRSYRGVTVAVWVVAVTW